MRFRSSALVLAILVVGCGKKKPETAPAPESGSGSTATTATPPPPPPVTRPTTDPNSNADRADLLRILQEPIFFEYNEDGIRSDAQATLDRKAAILLANPSLRIRVSGHADERGSDEYNLVLGTKRATAAKRFFETKGIDGGRVEIVSLGEERPADPASNEAAWAKNRRDEFEILSGGDRLVKPQ